MSIFKITEVAKTKTTHRNSLFGHQYFSLSHKLCQHEKYLPLFKILLNSFPFLNHIYL